MLAPGVVRRTVMFVAVVNVHEPDRPAPDGIGPVGSAEAGATAIPRAISTVSAATLR